MSVAPERTISISEETYHLIERLAIPFTDHVPDDVLKRELRKLVSSMTTVPTSASDGTGVKIEVKAAPEEGGVEVRRSYMDAQAKLGKIWHSTSGIWVINSDGDQLALPFASERQPNRWWLGVTEAEFSKAQNASIALLCQYYGGLAFAVELDSAVLANLTPRLKVAKNGQYMFNIKRVGPRFSLAIPGSEPFDVTEHVNHWRGSPLLG
jgi:hypothetical protein